MPSKESATTAAILGLGCALPDVSISQNQIAELAGSYCGGTAKQITTLNELYRRTGITTRGSILGDSLISQDFFPLPQHFNDNGPGISYRMERYAQEVVPLAVTACKLAFNDAQCQAERATHVITVSCTGFFAPGLDVALIKELGISDETARISIGFMGCHGALNGLQVAKAIVQADHNALVLLSAAELCSLHFQYGWSKDSMIANSLFADGAAAVIVGAANNHNALWKLSASSTKLLPNSEDMMTWHIGDNGFVMKLSAKVPDLITDNLRCFLKSWLDKLHLELDDIATWAVHPGGPRILDAVETSLSLPSMALSNSREVLKKYGNMSSPTLFFVLDELRAAKTPCVALGFGPGLVIEAFLLL